MERVIKESFAAASPPTCHRCRSFANAKDFAWTANLPKLDSREIRFFNDDWILMSFNRENEPVENEKKEIQKQKDEAKKASAKQWFEGKLWDEVNSLVGKKDNFLMRYNLTICLSRLKKGWRREIWYRHGKRKKKKKLGTGVSQIL